MPSRDAIFQTLRNTQPQLQAAGAKSLWIFGSVARAEDDFADVDILVEFFQPPTLNGFMDLKFLLEERLGLPVDLHSKGSCPPRFMHAIQADLLQVA